MIAAAILSTETLALAISSGVSVLTEGGIRMLIAIGSVAASLTAELGFIACNPRDEMK